MTVQPFSVDMAAKDIIKAIKNAANPKKEAERVLEMAPKARPQKETLTCLLFAIDVIGLKKTALARGTEILKTLRKGTTCHETRAKIDFCLLGHCTSLTDREAAAESLCCRIRTAQIKAKKCQEPLAPKVQKEHQEILKSILAHMPAESKSHGTAKLLLLPDNKLRIARHLPGPE